MPTRESGHSSASHSGSASRETAATSKSAAKETAPQTYNYNGDQVTVVRPATSADMGFKENGGDQVLVQYEDGHQAVAVKSEVEGA